MLTFEWDENKNQSNQQKHKLSFETARYVFLDPQAKRKPDRMINGEQKERIVGKILDVVIALVVFTERNGKICREKMQEERKELAQAI